MKPQKAWDNSREIIRNENDLINHRMTTFLTFQGFLFAGSSVLVSNTLDKEPPIPHLTVLFMVLIGAFIGFIMCCRTLLHIKAAARHIEATSEWWIAFREDKGYTGFRKGLPFPILVGTLGKPRLILWGIRKYEHEKAIEEHYKKLLDALKEHYGKLSKGERLFKSKREKILHPPSIIAASLPRILMCVWGFSFFIAVGVIGFFFYKHPNIRQDINTFVSGKKHLSSLCLDVQWANFYDGATVWIWECNGEIAQAWRIE